MVKININICTNLKGGYEKGYGARKGDIPKNNAPIPKRKRGHYSLTKKASLYPEVNWPSYPSILFWYWVGYCERGQHNGANKICCP